MTGDNPVPLIVNLYTYGAKDFDVNTALYYMLKAATDAGVGGDCRVLRATFVRCGQPGVTAYVCPANVAIASGTMRHQGLGVVAS